MYVLNLFFVGGWWGIFLGYSLVNFPRLVENCMKSLRSLLDNERVRRIACEKT